MSPWMPSPRVPGSGRLDERERVLTARVHTVVTVEADTVMVKALVPTAVPRCLAGEVSPGQWGRQAPFHSHTISGTVVRLQDTGNLRAPADYFQAFRLDYPGSPFRPNAPVLHLMEFAAVRPSQFLVAFGAPSVLDPSVRLAGNSREVRETAYAMVAAAEVAGVDPNTYRKEIAPWPFSGLGMTAAGSGLTLPEWWKQPGPVPRLAQIVEIGPAGRRTVARYLGISQGWQVPR
jgi:hypothetical protein